MKIKIKSLFRSKPYGKIEDIEKYLEFYYKDNSYRLIESMSLEKYIRFHRAGAKNDGDCLITAISTIMEFHKNIGRYNIPDNYDDIYEIVLGGAKKLKAYPIPLRGGTTPLLANNIAKRYLRTIGMKNYSSKNVYGMNWMRSIKKREIMLSEIRKLRPFALNISFGDYKNHSIVVIGYRIYQNEIGNIVIVLEIADAWVMHLRYLNLNNFNIISSITKIDPGI